MALPHYSIKVIDKRIFEITASPEISLSQNKHFGAVEIFMAVFLEKLKDEFFYEHHDR